MTKSEKILSCKCFLEDEEMTIKDYLKKLLSELWSEGESFSGKRPFGNSGWEYELYKGLALGGFIKCEKTEYDDGYIEVDIQDQERDKADKLISKAILSI